jgi:dethiobiotin synthetase
MKTLLVTGTDTGVGKTWIACLLIRNLLSQGFRTGAYKPVCSGAELDSAGELRWSDIDALRRACGNRPSIELVCPQRFRAPVAPNVAAGLEGRDVNDELLHGGIEPWRSLVDWLVIEGAGGIFCPLSNQSTVMDLARQLAGQVIVVAANRLGVINHTRLTVEALQAEGISVSAIVLNDTVPPETARSDLSSATNADQLTYWIPKIPMFNCAWQSTRLTPSSSATNRDKSVLGFL